ncbi:PAS domain S-box protein [Methanofollis tationis]|uniref:histidine kinase n=1 Tax=Methanofollis tationis TaxID=81417 RepID=A0A7K4HP18_9EURY|nr:PAS domain S-box protein [Methanofollis tationis]NVO67001.1 PAS domain S-box protein [Methanofollis tationis]
MRAEGPSRNRCRSLALILLIFLFSSLAVPALAAEQPAKKVLLLHSYHQGLSWTDEMTGGARSVFDTAETPIDLYVEYMDTLRLGDAGYGDREEAILGQKFAGVTFDLVICLDDYAFHFLQDRHASLFPGVPVVFCGLNYFDEADLEGWENCTGIVEVYDVDGTLDAALFLNPGIKNVFVVNDATETGISNLRILQGAADRYAGRLTFTYSGDATLDQIEETVQNLQDDTIVLLMTYYRSPDGTYYEYADVAGPISAASAVPVYGVWDFYLGHGIVGGKILFGREQGEAAAAMGLRILDGEPASAIPVKTDLQGRYVFDYRQLQRYGLEGSSLPGGSAVINRPSRLIEVDRSVAVAGVFAIATLAITVVFLVAHIRLRRRSERILQENEEKFRRIAESSFDIIFSTDIGGRFTYLSPSVLRVTGYEPADLLGRSSVDLTDPADHERCAEAFSAVAGGGSLEGLEVLFLKKDGASGYLEINAAPLYADGTVIGMQGAAREITERKQMERMRSEAFAQIDRNIGQFATLGDEIRNPLAVIVGVADLYCEEEQKERILEQAEIIDGIITQLDRGWIASEKVREFLRKH